MIKMFLQDEDAANLAEWIGDKNVETEGPGATSSEFDQFLAERAAAGDVPRRDKWYEIISDKITKSIYIMD